MPRCVDQLMLLTSLVLSGNHFGGDFAQALCTLPLEELYLDSNMVEQTRKIFIFDANVQLLCLLYCQFLRGKHICCSVCWTIAIMYRPHYELGGALYHRQFIYWSHPRIDGSVDFSAIS